MLYMRGMDMIMMDIGCEWSSHEEGGLVDFEAAEEAMVAVEVVAAAAVVVVEEEVGETSETEVLWEETEGEGVLQTDEYMCQT